MHKRRHIIIIACTVALNEFVSNSYAKLFEYIYLFVSDNDINLNIMNYDVLLIMNIIILKGRRKSY